MKTTSLSETQVKALKETQEKSIYWVAYGLTFFLTALFLILIPSWIMGSAWFHQFRPYVMGAACGLASGIAPIGARVLLRRFSR